MGLVVKILVFYETFKLLFLVTRLKLPNIFPNPPLDRSGGPLRSGFGLIVPPSVAEGYMQRSSLATLDG